jgi:large subunit ribosomal protein L11
VYEDRSFSFVTRTPPASDLIKKALSLEKAGGRAGHDVAGTISRQKIREIAELKAKDLHANNIEAAVRTIEGTARSMGIKVE